MTIHKKHNLSATMQIAVTASALSQGLKTAEMNQMNAEKGDRVRKVSLPNYLAAIFR
jgi:hypothetical protein